MPISRVVLVAIIALTGFLARAEDNNRFTLDSSRPSIWHNDIGSGFRDNTIEAGVNAGAGFGVRALGGSQRHNLALGEVQGGWMFTDVLGEGHWYAGNPELLGSVFGGVRINDRSAYVTGLTISMRYNFATGTRWIPFVGLGAGPGFTDIGPPDLGTKFQFNLNLTGGVRWFFQENTAASLQYRFMHMSNAGIRSPNLGVNSNLFLAGVSWFF